MSNPLDYKSSFAVFRFPRVFPQKYANPNVYHAFRMEPGRTVTNHFEPHCDTRCDTDLRIDSGTSCAAISVEHSWGRKSLRLWKPVMANPNGIGFAYATPGGRRPSRNRTVRRRAPWAPHILQERLRVTEPRVEIVDLLDGKHN